MDKNEVKKDLYRSKAMAKFSHYTSGNLYYTVALNDGIYQFPIATIEKVKKIFHFTEINIEVDNAIGLSADLGTTSFYNEIKGSELGRWISKAIDANEFIKLD